MYTSNITTNMPNSRLAANQDASEPKRQNFAVMTMGNFDPSFRQEISDSNPNKTQTQFNMNNVLVPSFAGGLTMGDFKVEGHSFNPDSEMAQTFFNI